MRESEKKREERGTATHNVVEQGDDPVDEYTLFQFNEHSLPAPDGHRIHPSNGSQHGSNSLSDEPLYPFLSFATGQTQAFSCRVAHVH